MEEKNSKISSLESLLATKKLDSDEVVKCNLNVERLGGEITISFKRLSYQKYKFIRKAATIRKRGVDTFDVDKYRVSVVLSCLVDPDFSKTDFLNSIGAHNGEVGLNLVFLPGEVVNICEAILSESGFSEDPFRAEPQDDEDDSQ